jgi:hypothetical protein
LKLIPLTKGQFAKVDDHRYEDLMGWKWFALWNKKTQSFYASRNINVNPDVKPWKNRQIRMHRYLLGLEHGDLRQGEHRDGDTLNNQDRNLRIATNSQNAMNRKPLMANSTTGHKGVSFRKDKLSRPWAAFVKVDGKQIHLGFRATRAEAIELRREGEKRYYGEFARAG